MDAHLRHMLARGYHGELRSSVHTSVYHAVTMRNIVIQISNPDEKRRINQQGENTESKGEKGRAQGRSPARCWRLAHCVFKRSILSLRTHPGRRGLRCSDNLLLTVTGYYRGAQYITTVAGAIPRLYRLQLSLVSPGGWLSLVVSWREVAGPNCLYSLSWFALRPKPVDLPILLGAAAF